MYAAHSIAVHGSSAKKTQMTISGSFYPLSKLMLATSIGTESATLNTCPVISI